MDAVKARVVASEEEFFKQHYDTTVESKGMICLTANPGYLLCECPCGCGSCMNLPVYPQGEPKPEGRASWSISKDQAFPSLEPSIRDISGCRFHGFLKAGLWTFCSDSGVRS